MKVVPRRFACKNCGRKTYNWYEKCLDCKTENSIGVVETTDEIRKQARQFLESLPKTELIALLEEAGFEVVEGTGKVIFTDKVIKSKPKYIGTIEGTFEDKR
ncbi:hypothetical protein [Neobacillus sp. DY30]|uniref:hypothetical protein n=1 Tax=Neobacillus sp. DY30 TaxID=3047871 RepID=UPI0024BFAF0A|nr:hypothetical protein [Neobacillus sp. DY30]WHY01847.1 hypothetical protein QNH29_06360 [Neobacillus sp. DY30]